MLLITLNSTVGSPAREVELRILPSVAAGSPGGSGRAFSELPIDEQRELVREKLNAEFAARKAAGEHVEDEGQAADRP